MSHRRRRPTVLHEGLVAPRRPRRPLTAYQAALIRRHACGRKHAHPTREAARAHIAGLILDGRNAAGQRPYRCPFRAPGAPWHWHIGRPIGRDGMVKLAAALRFGELPPQVQHPRTGEWSRVDPWSGASMGTCPPPPTP